MIFRQVLRDTVIRYLVEADTLAGDQVRAEQTEREPAPTLPILAVYVPLEHKTTISEGAAPLFRVAATVHVDARVANARRDQATADLDTLIDQVQVALLCNPDFMRSRAAWPIENVTEIVVRTEIDGSGDIYIGKGLVALTITYRDEYPPTLPDELRRIVVTVRPQTVPPGAPAPAGISPEATVVYP